MVRSTNPREFLTAREVAAVNAAVNEAERKTSAEVKVVLARHCWGDIKAKARRIFRDLGLDRTAQRNCVLLLFVVANREFLIYGDEGIHTKVGADFWNDIRDEMAEAFRRDECGAGIAYGVQRIGAKLAQYFPWQRDDVDEISDEIVYRR
jgi:uncharacterized membrane protein